MDIVTQVVLPLALAFMMFSMGLALVLDDFRRVVLRPKAFVIGALCQMLFLPLIALAVVLGWQAAFGLDPVLAVGFLILAACPGGVTSNLLTHLAKGDTALSISLTATISLASVITLPFIVNFGIDLFLGREAAHLPLGETVAGIFAITTIPVLLGMALRRWASTTALRLEPAARVLATALFVLIVIGAVAAEWDLVRRSFGDVGAAVLTLNLATMALGWTVARAARLDRRAGIAISLETGLQNGTLAIFVAATLLGNEAMIVPAGIYSLVMFFTAGAFVAALIRRPVVAEA
ncbi:bile acid:sodium symporter family protein [Algihabitans albus]|uniref:bile acid:sodium symporter family protein n=1 Tax=Algihabitans albus TaxID=2164067 RepID=UPI000E5CC545|nr:bile acid:sodium symporter family protein [Algihabitans albus]